MYDIVESQNRIRPRCQVTTRTGRMAHNDRSVLQSPIFTVIAVQLFICILIGIGIALVSFLSPVMFDSAKAYYTSKFLEGEDYLETLLPFSIEDVQTTLQNFTAAVLGQEPAAQESSQSSQSSTSGEELNGQGGQYEVLSDLIEKARQAPQNCTFSPVYLSINPVVPAYGNITSTYGYRVHPITGKDDFHTGVDIAAPLGDNIYAAYDGTVIESGSSDTFGNYIKIQSGTDIVCMYAHCSSIVAEVGQNIRAGEVIAKIGSTGVSTGPHLHFEISKDGVRIDPLSQLGDLLV